MWTLGILIGLPVTMILLVGFAITAIALFKTEEGYGETTFLAWMAVVAGAVTLIIGALAFFPYAKPYHYWEPISGTVASIDSRMVKDGDGMSERYVFKIGDDFYGVDDTRASTVKVGDEVRLSCIKEWQWQAAPGWGCRWAGQ